MTELKTRVEALGLSSYVIWLHFVALGGDVDPLMMEAYLEQALVAPVHTRNVFAHLIWELETFGGEPEWLDETRSAERLLAAYTRIADNAMSGRDGQDGDADDPMSSWAPDVWARSRALRVEAQVRTAVARRSRKRAAALRGEGAVRRGGA
jgi:hypothetical protein